MALQKNIIITVVYLIENIIFIEGVNSSIDKEVPIDSAYVKIISITGGKENLELLVGIYTSDKSNLIKTMKYIMIPSTENNSDNFIKQGYEYLKTLPEYEGAIDVLENGQML